MLYLGATQNACGTESLKDPKAALPNNKNRLGKAIRCWKILGKQSEKEENTAEPDNRADGEQRKNWFRKIERWSLVIGMKWRLEQPRWSTGVLVRVAGTYMCVSTGKRCTNAAWCASNQRGVASCRAGRHEASVHSSGPWLQAATPPEKSLFFPSVFPRARSLSSSSLRSNALKRARKTLHRSVSVVCCSLIRRSLKMFTIASDRTCCGRFGIALEEKW